MRRNRAAVAALVLVAALLGFDATAGAASLDRSGWWWRPQSGLGTALPAPPHVPEDGLLVAGEPGGPTAVAAVRFVLEDDERDPELTLAVADDRGGEAAVLLACPTSSGWRPAHAGRWDDRPEADCEQTPVEGVRAEDGLSWTFDLAPLLVDGVVEAVLVPGSVPEAPAGVDGSTFSLAFEAPTDASLATTTEQPTSDDFDLAPFPDGFGGGDGSGFGGGTSFEPPASSPSFTPPASPSLEPPAPTGPPSDDLVAATGTGGAGAGTPERTRPVAAQPGVGDDEDRILAGVVLALVAAAVLWAAQQPIPALRRLGALASPDDGASASAVRASAGAEQTPPRMGGIGRFARPRTGPVPRL